MSRNGHLRKEVFSTPANVSGLIYATTTEVYRNGILTAIFTQGHIDTGEEGAARLGNSFIIGLSDEKGVCANEFAKLQSQKLAEELQKSLPSS